MKTSRFLALSVAALALAGVAFLCVHPVNSAAAAPNPELAMNGERLEATPVREAPVTVHFALASDPVRLAPELRANFESAPALFQKAQYQFTPISGAGEKPPFYQDPNFIGWAVGTISAIAAVFMRRDATQKQKALNAVIVGVERATQLPQVQAAAKHVKEEIQRYAVANGVEQHLNDAVRKLTEAMPQPSATPPTS